ncbi:MAG: J domain-containing protein, partial [Azonexus sp.]|nr:J domain-containing protein [Azonexus sp.]
DDAPQQTKRKTAKQEAADLKKEDAAKKISQTVREVYRKLASALHPDRETDAAIREKKTEQMQRVNQAYQNGDLLALLNLQFEIEQIDTEHLTSLSGERLTHYNQVLREQLAELKAEVEAVTAPFMDLCQWQRKVTPDDVDRKMSAEIVNAQSDLRQVKEDRERLQNPAELSRFIREIQTAPEFDDDLMLDIFLNTIAPPQPPRKSGKKKTSGRR